MPPPQQFYASPAVSSIIFSKWLNPAFLVLLVFLTVALPLSSPSSSASRAHRQSALPLHSSSHHNSSTFPPLPLSSKASTFADIAKQWPHWSATLDTGDFCPSARIWATHPGSFCVTLWNSPYLTNRTELEAREGRAIKHFCEMDRILERFDCAQEYSVNVMRGQCKLCRDAYREWACAMVTDTLDDGRLDCETKLMPCPSCASICHQVMRLCPYLTPDRSQAGPDGKLAPQVSQYGGHPAFYCPLENDDPSDPAYTSLCFHQSPYSSDPDYVHNVCTNPPIHHHHNPYAEQEDEKKPYFNRWSRTTNSNNNVRHSYFSQTSTDKRFASSSRSKSPEGPSSKGRREDYLNSNERASNSNNNNNNNYYDSDSATNKDSFNNQFDYNGEESSIAYDDHEYGGGGEGDPVPPHYTSCCWTYASSVVTFTTSQAYPNYGSDSYFSSDEVTSSSSTVLLTNSGGGGSDPAPRLNRKPSSDSDNRVILNCCDGQSGKCKEEDPSADDENIDEDEPTQPEEEPEVPEPAHRKLKSSRKRSSENIGKPSSHSSQPKREDTIEIDHPAVETGLKTDGLIPPLAVVRFVKDLPQPVVVLPKSKGDQVHHDLDGDDGQPKPTHIPPGVDYDEHYLDTEPDGDGGSSSTELEDEDVFEGSFSNRGEWDKAGHRQQHPQPDYNSGATWSREPTFPKKPSEENHGRPSPNNSPTTPSSTSINNLRNNFKHNNNKNSNTKEEGSRDLGGRSGGSKGSSSVHYQKNAFMAIVIGSDDVDRRHLNLRTGEADITAGDGVERTGGGGAGSSGGHRSDPDNIDDFRSVPDFPSKFSSSSADIHFNSIDFSSDYETEPGTDEVYFRRTRGNLDSDTEVLTTGTKGQDPGDPFAQDPPRSAGSLTMTMSSAGSPARLSASSSLIGTAYSALTKLKGSLLLVLVSPSVQLTSSVPSFSSSKLSRLRFEAPRVGALEESKPSSFTISYVLFTSFLVLLLLLTNNFLPIPLRRPSTERDEDLHPSAAGGLLEPSSTQTIIGFSQKRRWSKNLISSATATILPSSVSRPSSRTKSVMRMNSGLLGKSNDKDKDNLDKAAGERNAEDNQDCYKNYYDEVRNCRGKVPGGSATYYYYSANHTSSYEGRNGSFKYDLLHVQSGGASGIPAPQGNPRRIFDNIVSEKRRRARHPPPSFRRTERLLLKSERNDSGDSSCSHQLALLYYKVIKFLLILNYRSSDDDTITILSVQHNNNNYYYNKKNKNNSTVITKLKLRSLGYFVMLGTATRLKASDPPDLQSHKSWRGRTRGRRRVDFSLQFYFNCIYILTAFTIKKLEFKMPSRRRLSYFKDLQKSSSYDNTGINLCSTNSYRNLCVETLSIILELRLQVLILCSNCPRASVSPTAAGGGGGCGCVTDCSGCGQTNSSAAGHSGDSHCRLFKDRDKKSPPPLGLTLQLLLFLRLNEGRRLRILSYYRLSDSWVTTNCTITTITSSNTTTNNNTTNKSIAYSALYVRCRGWGLNYYYYYYYLIEYSNRLTSRVTIINKIIQFVVQYNLNGEEGDAWSGCGSSSDRGRRRRRRKKCFGQFKVTIKVFKKLFKLYSHCSRNRGSWWSSGTVVVGRRLEVGFEIDEFPTKSYSKFLAFWLINLKVSGTYIDSNEGYSQYHSYPNCYDYSDQESIIISKAIRFKFLMCTGAGSLLLLLQVLVQEATTKCQGFIIQECQPLLTPCQPFIQNCQRCQKGLWSEISQGCHYYSVQFFNKLLLLAVLGGYLYLVIIIKLKSSLGTPALFRSNSCNSFKRLQRDYYSYVLISEDEYLLTGRLVVCQGPHFHGQSISVFSTSQRSKVTCSILPSRIDNNYENYKMIVVLRLNKECNGGWWWWWCTRYLLSGSLVLIVERNRNSWTRGDDDWINPTTINTGEALIIVLMQIVTVNDILTPEVESVQVLTLFYSHYPCPRTCVYLGIFNNVLYILSILRISRTLKCIGGESVCKFFKDLLNLFVLLLSVCLCFIVEDGVGRCILQRSFVST